METSSDKPRALSHQHLPTQTQTVNTSDEEMEKLMRLCDEQLSGTDQLLEEASELVQRMGEIPNSSGNNKSKNRCITSDLAAGGTTLASATTAGHSNTDHIILWTNDYETDRIAELKRNMQNRIRARQPEGRGEDRWDKPRIPGERRRRIVRDKDAPGAPPEPPNTGYVIFVGQMTAKMRHDRPNTPHSQTAVVQEISKLWRIGLSDQDREYYSSFAEHARSEYETMHMEFRATGAYRPSRNFCKLEGVGPWVHVREAERNALEQELASYDTVKFPLRPRELDEAYEKREAESKRRRKLKLKGLLNADGTERTERLPNAPPRRRAKRKDPPKGDAATVEQEVEPTAKAKKRDLPSATEKKSEALPTASDILEL